MSDALNKTAVVLVDPYNDFLHEKGGMYGAVIETLKKTDAINHMLQLHSYAKQHGVPVFYALHRQFVEGDLDNWLYPTATNEAIKRFQSFKKGSFGAQVFPGLEPDVTTGDIICEGHMNIRWVPDYMAIYSAL